MEDLIRISVANLAYFLQVPGKNAVPFGILNPKKGMWKVLGGGAELTEAGMNLLKNKFLAERFEKDEKTGLYDARFVVAQKHLSGVFRFFQGIAGKSNPHEMDPVRDILAELSGKENIGAEAILSSGADLIDTVYIKTVQQKPAEDGIGTSSRAAAVDIPTRRLFRLYKLIMPKELFNEITASNQVHILSKEELETTAGGSKEGLATDGKIIADNLFAV